MAAEIEAPYSAKKPPLSCWEPVLELDMKPESAPLFSFSFFLKYAVIPDDLQTHSCVSILFSVENIFYNLQLENFQMQTWLLPIWQEEVNFY